MFFSSLPSSYLHLGRAWGGTSSPHGGARRVVGGLPGPAGREKAGDGRRQSGGLSLSLLSGGGNRAAVRRRQQRRPKFMRKRQRTV
ncbi:hypothetical protein EE612_059440 [Oryza sativa]|nr:hypothetical protein EE612_059440 [Oryza sativa]